MIILKIIVLLVNYIVLCIKPDQSFFKCVIVFCLGTFCDYVPLAYMVTKKNKNEKGVFLTIIGITSVVISIMYFFVGIIGIEGKMVVVESTHTLETTEDFWA